MTRSLTVSLGLLLLATASVLVVVATILLDWRRRVRIEQAEADRLIEPPPGRPGIDGIVAGTCVFVGIAAVVWAEAALTPLAVAMAALATLTVGHRRRSNAVGALGLVLTAESVIVAALAWLPASPANGLLGCSLAGGYMFWLARFWRQQLDSGTPWTTAGRLVPIARCLGYVAILGQAGFILTWALHAEPGTFHVGWQAVLAGLFTLGHWAMLARNTVAGRPTQ